MDVRRVDQLRADKVCPTRRESPRSKDFPRRVGLYVEVATRRAQIIKDVRRVGQLQAAKVFSISSELLVKIQKNIEE